MKEGSAPDTFGQGRGVASCEATIQCRRVMKSPDAPERARIFTDFWQAHVTQRGSGMNAYYDMVPGYCFELQPLCGGWATSSEDDWIHEVYDPSGRERLVGFRELDAGPCAVFRCRGGRYRAQLLAVCERSPRRAVGS